VVFIDINQTIPFTIRHDQLPHWQALTTQFSDLYGVNESLIRESVISELSKYKYPHDIINGQSDDYFQRKLPAYVAVQSLFQSSFNDTLSSKFVEQMLHDSSVSRPIFTGDSEGFVPTNPHIDAQMLLSSRYQDQGKHITLKPSSVPAFIRARQRILIYQSKGTYTGGTIALELLKEQFVRLGYDCVLCDSTNLEDTRCTSPSGSEIVITGEWCSGVLASHGTGPEGFLGRGLQYHLGFHHYDDQCRGHVTVTDSQYLRSTLAARTLGGYYLGCEMVPAVRDMFVDMISLPSNPSVEEDVATKSLAAVVKEDLIVLDTDLSSDYTPENMFHFSVPEGYVVIEAKGIPPGKMPLILSRAKIVVDLAMPGPERLAGEGVLLGAIPIVSNRWNGASEVDFPGIRKVDHLNGTEITEAIYDVATNYHNEIRSSRNSIFQSYISSMWRRIRNTADIFAASSVLHFVLVCSTLVDEELCTLQVLALLYTLPLASIDIYVRDVGWFFRHHYMFVSLLKTGGYLRFDMLDPTDTMQQSSHSYVRIRPVRTLHGILNAVMKTEEQVMVRNTGLLPSWNEGVLCILAAHTFPRDAFVLIDALGDLKSAEDPVGDSNVDICDVGVLTSEGELVSRLISPDGSAHLVPKALYDIGIINSYGESSHSKIENTVYKVREVGNTSFSTVCDVINMHNGTETTNFIYSIVSSTPWNMIYRYLRETSSMLCTCF